MFKLIQSSFLTVLIGLSATAAFARSGVRADDLALALPAGCEGIAVRSEHVLSFRAYATGVQIYRWNGTQWAFVAPVAGLFVDPDHRRQVGTHFAGPTWLSNWGSFVTAARVDGCTPDANAIPWLLLQSTSTDTQGIFGNTTLIQRVNTTGGLAPQSPGTTIGTEVRVPYTAEYYFYRAAN